MKPADNIKKFFKNAAISTNPKADQAVFNEVLTAQEKMIEAQPAEFKPSVWRIIMKSRITKFAAAAVIIIAVVLSIIFLDKSTPSAYALEQTLKAYDGIRFVHIKDFKDGESEPKEFWVELDEQEQVKNLRVYIPAWDMPSEGPKIAVWKKDKLQVWIKNNNVLLTIHDKTRGLEMLTLVKQCDPRFVVKELHQLEAEGKVDIKTSEPLLKSEPIVITAKFLPQSNDVGQIVLSVDQNTKLVTRAVLNQMKGFGGYQNSGLLEYSDYNIEVDENVFTLWEVPENVTRIDQTGPEVGLAQAELEDDEIAVELARQFLQALIDKDYDKAGNLCGGIPAKVIQRMGERMSYTKIICIEQPTSRPNNRSKQAISVPCVFEVNKNNEVFALRKNIHVEPVEGKPNIWIVSNDNDDEIAEITVDPTDTTSTFLKNINSKLASLDINKSTADDIISVLGKPLSYRFKNEVFEEDNLPETYVMTYPGYFMVSIHKNQIRSWGSEEIPGYVFSGLIQIGSTLDEVLKVIGPPEKIIEGFRLGAKKFEDNILYKNMNGRKGYCYYGTINKGKKIRMLFRDNKVFSLHEYRTEPIKNIE